MCSTLSGSDHSVAIARGNIRERDNCCSEIELKLSGNVDALAAVFGSMDDGNSHASRVISTYYDTTDTRLWRKGYSFRLRRNREGYELTLKHESGFVRGEWTSRVNAPVADISRLPATAPHHDLDLGTCDIVPVCASDITRRQKLLNANAASIEVSLDVGRIVAGGRETPVAELEFELLSGPVADMLRHVRSILADHGLSAFTCSKAARGMTLYDSALSVTTRAPRPHLRPGDTLDEAVGRYSAGVAIHILQNICVAAEGRDPEGVHQVRVGLRRFRSAIGLLRPYLDPRAAAMNKRAKLASGQLGTARDLDVLVRETLPRILRGSALEPGLAKLAETARARMVDARRDVRTLAVDPSFNCFLIDLLLFGQSGGLVIRERDTPVGRISRPLLKRRHRQLLKAGRDFATLSDRQRHKVRIGVKKLRYACEFFHAQYPADSTRPYIRRLANLQQHLGRHNDLIVARRLTGDLFSGTNDTAVNAQELMRLFDNRLRASNSRLLREWERTARAEPFWRTKTM